MDRVWPYIPEVKSKIGIIKSSRLRVIEEAAYLGRNPGTKCRLIVRLKRCKIQEGIRGFYGILLMALGASSFSEFRKAVRVWRPCGLYGACQGMKQAAGLPRVL